MANLIVIVILVLVVVLAIRYIIKQKKSGAHCIGCPESGHCSKNCGCKPK